MTVRVLTALIGLFPMAVGGILVFVGLGDPTDPENLILLGIGGVLVATGGYKFLTAISGNGSAA